MDVNAQVVVVLCASKDQNLFELGVYVFCAPTLASGFACSLRELFRQKLRECES